MAVYTSVVFIVIMAGAWRRKQKDGYYKGQNPLGYLTKLYQVQMYSAFVKSLWT
jgi:hypothetical protein